MTVLPGSTVNITWSFNDDVSQVTARVWYFTSSDGSFVNKRLAVIIFDDDPRIFNVGLSGVSIVKPATLLLKNVNQTYDGTYRFDLSGRGGGSSQVVVIIASKFRLCLVILRFLMVCVVIATESMTLVLQRCVLQRTD